MKQKEITEKQWSQVKAMITQFKLNNTMLAEVLGITKGTFCLKMNPEKADKFTEPQKLILWNYLIDMGKFFIVKLTK